MTSLTYRFKICPCCKRDVAINDQEYVCGICSVKRCDLLNGTVYGTRWGEQCKAR